MIVLAITVSIIFLVLFFTVLKAFFLIWKKLRQTQYICVQTRLNTTYLYLAYLENKLNEYLDAEDYENAEILRNLIKHETVSQSDFLKDALTQLNKGKAKK